MNTIFWLGAHKTGTTFLQNCLDLSQDALLHHGVKYVNLEDFRSRYQRPLLDNDSPDSPTPSEYRAGAAQTLIFDENISGYVQHALSKSGFYPEAARRTMKVGTYLGLEPDEIVYGIRSYSTYLPSLYIETLKSTQFVTFDEYLAKAFRPRRHRPNQVAGGPIDFTRLDWVTVLERLARSYPKARLRVYFHEELRDHEADLLGEVLGLPPTRFTLPDGIKRVWFSARTMSELHHMHEVGTVSLRDVHRTAKRFPTSPGNGAYAPFDHAELLSLQDQYESHVATIRSDPRFEVIDLTDAHGTRSDSQTDSI